MTQKTKPKSPKINKYDVFVFGSNEGGIHGAGAAKCAREHYDMPIGKSYGHYGKCFAIPTKSDKMEVLPDIVIEYYVKGFLAYASGKPKLTFKVTQIGCGLSHKDPSIMAAMFMMATDNVLFDEAWAPYMPTLPAEQFWGTYND